MKLWLARTLYRIGLMWWTHWSKLYRLLYHRRYASLPIAMYNIDRVTTELHLLTWQPDTKRELWDACGEPGWVQHCIDKVRAGHPQPKGALDCDDFAVWACKALQWQHRAKLLTVVWVSEDGTLHGHVVCLVGEGWHLSNWGLHGGYGDLVGVVGNILSRVNAQALVGWATLDANMKVLEWRRG